jgi:hypothetical protein
MNSSGQLIWSWRNEINNQRFYSIKYKKKNVEMILEGKIAKKYIPNDLLSVELSLRKKFAFLRTIRPQISTGYFNIL